MRVVRKEELAGSGSDGNYAGGLATLSRGAEEVSVIRQRQEPGAVNLSHSHDREEVMVMLSGGVLVTTDEEDVGLSAGDAVIFSPGTKHRVRNHGDTDAEWIIVAPSGVRFIFADGREASPEWAR